MNIGRRLFLHTGLALTALAALPRVLLAAAWPEKAFEAPAVSGALLDLFGTDQTVPSDQINLKAPEIAGPGGH